MKFYQRVYIIEQATKANTYDDKQVRAGRSDKHKKVTNCRRRMARFQSTQKENDFRYYPFSMFSLKNYDIK